jgi:hypothetical protein
MFELIGLVAAGAVSAGGYIKTRDFVHHRLRYVDSVQGRRMPLIAGTVAALAVAPVAWALPFIGTGAAVLFGIGIGAGTRAGVARIRQGEMPGY